MFIWYKLIGIKKRVTRLSNSFFIFDTITDVVLQNS